MANVKQIISYEEYRKKYHKKHDDYHEIVFNDCLRRYGKIKGPIEFKKILSNIQNPWGLNQGKNIKIKK